MNNIYFDCSLFQDQYPELAQQVMDVCQEIGFEGLDQVRIPYIQAVRFAKRSGSLYKEFNNLDQYIGFSHNTEYKNTHATLIKEWLIQNSNFMSFYNRLRHVNRMFAINNDWINRVAYGLYNE